MENKPKPNEEELANLEGNEEPQVEKKKLFGLSEEDLAELDKKDLERYWNN
jgi:hypothetical protein